MLLPATTTTTTTSSEQPHQLQRTFQTWSSTLFDDGHYSDVSGSGVAARIPSDYDYYNYIEMDQLSAVDEGAVEQRQTSYDNYQRLDPSALARLRQPPAPSVYDRLSPNVPDMNHGVLNTEPGDANPDNPEGLDPASLLPYEDDGSSSKSTGSAVHNDNTTEEPRQTSSDDYQGLDPSVLETLRHPPTPPVYASLSPNVPVMNQDVNNTGAGGANPHNVGGFDLTSLLPCEDAIICSTSQTTLSAGHD